MLHSHGVLVASIMALYMVGIVFGKRAIVFDCGSSGSRIHVYEWRVGKIVEDVKEIYTENETPGLSSFVKDPKKAVQSLNTLLIKAMDAEKSLKGSQTEVYVFATAGMRLVPQSQASAVLSAIREYFIASEDFTISRNSSVRIITGEEEGVFGWIQTNYALKKFTNPSSSLVGALDMGGASTQITITPPDSVSLLEGGFTMRIQGKVYTVYSHSYLKYGVNEFETLMMEEIVSRGTPSKDDPLTYEHPCYFIGYKTDPVRIHGQNIIFEGTSDIGLCSTIIEDLMYLDTFCPTESCAMNGVYQPSFGSNRLEFYAFSSFYYNVVRMLLVKSGESLTSNDYLSEMNAKLLENCQHMDYATMKKKIPDNPFLQYYCSQGMYIETVLKDGYKLKENLHTITFTSKLPNDVTVGWALGSLIYEEQLIDVEFGNNKRIDTSLVVLSILVAVMSITILVLATWLSISLGCVYRYKKALRENSSDYRKV